MANKKTTKNAKGGGTIHSRSDGRWEGRYSVGFDTRTGKQIQRSIYGTSQKEVREKLTKVTPEIDDGSYFEPTKMRLGEWMDIWLNEYCGDKKYLTVKGYRAKVNTHIKPQLGDILLSQLTPVDVQKFYNRLLHPQDGSKGICPKSIKNTHGVLSKALNQAVTNGYIRSNPCHCVTLPRVEKVEVCPLNEEQIAELLEPAEQDETYGILLKVIVLTGLRESEAMGITWDAVDFKRGIVRINKQLQKRPESAGGFVFCSLKNGKGRVLKPAPYVMELLQKRYQQQIADSKAADVAWMAWHSEEEHKKALVFTTLFGEHLHPQTVYNHFKKLAAEIGAPRRFMISAIPMRFFHSRTAMMCRPCKETLAMRQQRLPWMCTDMFPKQ